MYSIIESYEKSCNECWGTISNSSSSDDEDDTDFMAFVFSSCIIDPLDTTLNVQEVIVEDDRDKNEYEQDELLNTYMLYYWIISSLKRIRARL